VYKKDHLNGNRDGIDESWEPKANVSPGDGKNWEGGKRKKEGELGKSSK